MMGKHTTVLNKASSEQAKTIAAHFKGHSLSLTVKYMMRFASHSIILQKEKKMLDKITDKIERKFV